MPSKSEKQRRFMAAAANSAEFASKAGIDQRVAKEFHAADKKKTRATGRKGKPKTRLSSVFEGKKT